MPRTRRFFALVTAAAALASVVLQTGATIGAAPSGIKEFEKSGMSGSGAGVMVTMTLPARIDRVAIRRDGSGEAWALGTSAARLPGWNPNNEPQGQVVFLRYLPSTGWQLAGPPTDANYGTIINPVLSDMAIAPNGEGWSVGSTEPLEDGTREGTFLYHAPGSSTWVQIPLEPSQTTTQFLQSVSLAQEGGRIVGYASGQGSTIYRYLQGEPWSREPTPAVMSADLTPGLFISAVSADVAWAVSDSRQSNGVKIYRRSAGGGWSKVLVGDPIFDSPPATGRRGGYNAKAWGSAVAATPSTVWVGGAMQPGEAPFTPPNDQESDVTRPFLVQISGATGAVQSTYCPNLYRLRQRGDAPIDTTALCEKPFPSASYDIPSISIVGGEAFAGGQGLFHFKSGSWFREPNTNGYLISISMASASDGWVATTGNTVLRGLAIRSNSPFVGRWTSESQSPRRGVARWAQTQANALESVAFSPDSRTAMAVGQRGAAIYFDSQLGWDKRLPNIAYAIHGIAWPDSRPWVVGEKGLIGRYNPGSKTWSYDRANGQFPTLFGVAFKSPSEGVAVGAGGTIISYDGSAWRRDSTPTNQTLYAVAATPTGYVAVGRQGTILEKRSGSWIVHGELTGILDGLPYRSPALYATTVLADGQIIVGGQRGTLLRAEPGGQFAIMYPPLEGTVLALASGGSQVYASVSPDENKFNAGGAIQPLRGSVLTLRGGTWTDISLSRRIRVSYRHDSSSFDDPVFSIAIQSDGVRGWAVGGSAAGIPDVNPPEGHIRAAPYDSSSVYRIDLQGDPEPRHSSANVVPPSGINFAVFGESWCGRPPGSTSASGLCSSSVGTGTQADLVALRIRDEINKIAYPKTPNGPKFVLFTGNMRQTGVPEELAQFKSYLAGFDIPVYAALGNMDLFAGLAGDLINVNQGTTGTNDYWKETFFDMARPWGNGGLVLTPTYIRPLALQLPNSVVHPNLARTHYAFDVIEEGRAALRVIVIDSSTKSYGNSVDQEPQFESQDSWLSAVISNAKIPPGIPTVVVMNQPTVYPLGQQVPNWVNQTDRLNFENVAAPLTTAVFAGGFRWNTTDSYPARRDVTPLYIMGGGGAALGYEAPQSPIGSGTGGPLPAPSLIPEDGFYHGWHLVTVDPDPAARNLLGQAPHSFKTFMALEYLGIHALDGESVSAGYPLKFQGFARQMSGGWSDPNQAKSSTFKIGFPFLLGCAGPGLGEGYCRSPNVIHPPYRFWSENPKIAQFVIPNPGGGFRSPVISPITGGLIPDTNGTFGFLCTFNKGTVGINLESGMINRRMVITVGPGDGPCVKHAVLPDPDVPALRRPLSPEVLLEAEEPARPPIFRPSTLPEPLVVVLPPAPIPIAAPAPPASAAGARKEEEEYQHESEGQEGEDGRASFAVLSHSREARSFDPILTWLYMGAGTIMGLALALITAQAVKKPKPGYVR